MKKLRPQLYALIEALDTCREGDNPAAARALECFIDAAGNALNMRLCGCKCATTRDTKGPIMRPSTTLKNIEKMATRYNRRRELIGTIVELYRNLGTVRAVEKTGIKGASIARELNLARYVEGSEKCRETQKKVVRRVLAGEPPSDIAKDYDGVFVGDICFILCKNEIIRTLINLINEG